MKIKKRPKPKRLEKLEALARLLPNNHPKMAKILNEIGRRRGGYYGELKLDYYLKFLPEGKYLIIPGIRLIGEYGAFQIDTLVLSTYFILIVETKNYSDEVHFEKNFNQVIRKSRINGEESFEDPIAQAERHEIQLRQFFRVNKMKIPPIEALACISNASTIIKADPENTRVTKKVFHAEHILNKVKELEQKHSEPKINTKTLNKIYHFLLSKHTPYDKDILKSLEIEREELLKGVPCPKCDARPMKYHKGYFCCQYCGTMTKDAHIQIIKYYLLVVSPTITNKEFCDFVCLPSRNIGFQLLSKMNLSHTGNTKGRKYFLPNDE